MSFQVPYESSPPETPERDRSRSLWSNGSTTPAGPPPSSTKSFTPQGQPTATEGGSRMAFSRNEHSFSTNKFNNSVFTKSGNINTNDSIFGSSFGSTDFPMPRNQPSTKPTTASNLRFSVASNGTASGDFMNFGHSNGFASSQMSDYQEENQEMEPEELEEEEEEVEEAEEEMDLTSQAPPKPFSFTSMFGNPQPAPAPAPAQRKPIYSNPSDAKRPKLDEHWTNQSPRKAKLSPKKASAMPSILHNLASRTRMPAVEEPSDMILATEDILGKLADEMKAAEERHVDFDAVLADISQELAATWQASADHSGISRPYNAQSGIGPGDQAPNLVKASFIASLLLQINQPARQSPSNMGLGMVQALARSSNPKPYPQILLEWLNENHAPQTKGLQELRYVEPNPTASSNFWDIITASVLRGHLDEAAKVLRSADFNYARSALEDGLQQPGYRGAQLQNIQREVNRALLILDSCPGSKLDNWNVDGAEWSAYRRRVVTSITELEEFAEGEEKDESIVPVPDNRFQAINFGLNNLNQKPMSFTQSARMAESRIPWSIYQSLRSIYRILLGDPAAIKAHSQDWVEATIALTAWWDGEDDDGADMEYDAGLFGGDFLRSRGPRVKQTRAVTINYREAYISRLALASSNVTSESGSRFQPNSLSSVEVGLASVFEGNVQGVLELIQRWSLCIAATVAEIASQGLWFESSQGQRRFPGLSENDLMVLSYGQDNKAPSRHLRKDDILRDYAFGLYEIPVIQNETSSREGWELGLEVLSRLNDTNQMKKAVSEIVDKLPLENSDQLDKLVVLCSDLDLEDQGRRVSERFGDMLTSKSENFGLALVCYARAQSRRKVKSVVDLLISYSLVQSRAYPATADLDSYLLSMMKEPKACLSSIAEIDEEAARILQFYLSGYATLRRFYEIRDEESELKEGERPRYKPLARRRAAAQALAAVIGSAADNIYGGLYDPDRDSAVQVDGLLALLGEALVFVSQPTPVLTVSQQFTILSAIEDLETVTPRVYAQCEECFRSTLLATTTSDPSCAPPSPRALFKKSITNFNASTFSLMGNGMLESARTRSGSGSASGPASMSGSGVLVPRPSDMSAVGDRGWDWRVGLPESAKGEDILRMLRSGLARGLSHGALGSSV
ncbi:uncharacterized protein N7511_007293 [Penicillium nucicola]|uniref:uncharacterized protein n=1 Tax=Penicillium nucicola TaxID=1850975 RepID=UPI002545166C|nr:uncharacterized protein N7511_007293 [Penicillium nucicola]KAJ5757111.1 hypothetical protein N7511_007293 [Penicillium nucicola]